MQNDVKNNENDVTLGKIKEIDAKIDFHGLCSKNAFLGFVDKIRF